MQSFLYLSSRIEDLSWRLALLLDEKGDPFQEETILIQNAGMERYLSLAIARQNGISTQIAFQFPAKFLKQILQVKSEERFPLDPDRMSWAIEKVISLEINHPDLRPIKNYLHRKSEPALFHLSRHIADIFDRYIVERIEWMQAWLQSESVGMPDSVAQENQKWQARIWRRMVALYPDMNIPARIDGWQQQFASDSGLPEHLPRRLFLFGITNLPALYRQLIKTLSTKIAIYWFYPIFAHSDAPQDDASRSDASQDDALPISPLPQEEHPLGLAWRQSGQLLWDQVEQQFLQEGSDWQAIPLEHPVARQGESQRAKQGARQAESQGAAQKRAGAGREAERTLLYRLQAGNRQIDASNGAQSSSQESNADAARPLVSTEDRSLTIQACHSELREVQELYNWLLDQFRQDPKLAPEDVLVLAPNIEDYTPLIEAVFGYPQEEPMRLPYSIADLPPSSEKQMTDDLFRILELASSRFSSPEVMSILELDSISRRFSFSHKELGQIANWISLSGIYWGRDEEHLKRLALPISSANTFARGLERLLLSVAIPSDRRQSFFGIAPVAEIEGDMTELLCRFVEAIELLISHMYRLEEMQTLKEWARLLDSLQRDIFATDELTHLFQELEECFEQCDYKKRTDLASVREYLRLRASKKHAGREFLQGGITFSGLYPMRSIPAPIVCILGMQESNFPRRELRPQFDLFEISRKAAELGKAEVEKLLFLEAFFSARRKLFISHAGKSPHHPDRDVPPCIQIEELKEYIDEHFAAESGTPLSQQISVEHRLQGFHRSYFQNDGPLFSYSSDSCRSAAALLQKREEPRPFISHFQPTFPPEEQIKKEANEQGKGQDKGQGEREDREELKEKTEYGTPEQPDIELSALLYFFRDPVAYFVQRGLKTYISKESSLEDQEPLESDGLLRYHLRNELTTDMLAAQELQQPSYLQASGRFPQGSIGQLMLKQNFGECANFIERLSSLLEKDAVEDILESPDPQAIEMEGEEIDLLLGSLRLMGSCRGYQGRGGELLLIRPGSLRPEDCIKAWLYHLALQLSSQKNPDKSIGKNVGKSMGKNMGRLMGLERAAFVGWEGSIHFSNVEQGEGERYLQELLQIYQMGQSMALPLFPKSSFAFARAWFEKGSMDKAIQAAAKEWYHDPFSPGGGEEIRGGNALCFRHRDPMNPDSDEGRLFQKLSKQIFTPLLNHLVEVAAEDAVVENHTGRI